MTDGPTLHPLRTDTIALVVPTRQVLDAVAASAHDPGERLRNWHGQFPREDDRDALAQARLGDGWSSWLVCRTSDLRVVGTLGFFGPPEPAADGRPEVEVGYGLVEEARGQGLMTAALGAVLFVTDAAGIRVRAGTTADNAASLALLRRAGFVVRSEDPNDAERQVVLAREPA